MNTRTIASTRKRAGVPAPATDREHLVTVLFGLWMTVGLFLDGYFHQNLDAGADSESFFTPWHGVFYAGFTASALWLATMARRRTESGRVGWTLANLPPGYDGARLGLALFAAGGVGDALWHSRFGVEKGIDALLSPTHLLLFVGLLLILTTPLRAGRTTPSQPPRPWMLTGSTVATAALVGFFLNFVWGLGIAAQTRVVYDPVTEVGETAVIAGVASTLVATLVLLVAVRTLLAAGPPPPGAVVLLFAVVAALVSVAFDEDAEGVAAAVAAGLVLEIALRRSRAAGANTVALCFAGASAVLWSIYFGLLGVLDGMEWQAELWSGTVVLNALLGWAIGADRPRSNVQA